MKNLSNIVIFVITEYLLKNSALLYSLVTMSTRARKIAAVLAVMAILFCFVLPDIGVAHSAGYGGNLDLFTGKEPNDGRGPNMPSDSYGPEESVILYALVTYDNAPIRSVPVAFHVVLPSNASFSLSTLTNATGIAATSLTILMPPVDANESDIFGEWSVAANAVVNSTPIQDTLTFRVDWIVKLLSVKTIDEELGYRTSFGRGGDVGLEVVLRSIALTVKTATIAIVIQDVFNAPVSYTEIDDFKLQPNEKLVYVYFKLRIPSWVIPGNSTIYVSALTSPASSSGVPYCPSISTHFSVSPYEPVLLDFHDVTVVNVVSSTPSVERGQPLAASILVGNEGTTTESFNVSVYFGNTLVNTQQVTDLPSHSGWSFDLNIDTSSSDIGNYTISASIPILANEADTTDNLFISTPIEIRPYTPPIIHNVAITNVTASNSSVYVGELVQISVNVSNKGTETETFNVSAYYDSLLIGTILTQAFPPNTYLTLVFSWNTSSVNVGFYDVSATVELSTDVDFLDNTFVDGLVEVKTKPPPIHDVAVSNIYPYASKVYIGDNLSINVTVRNRGDQAESFNVLLFYNSSAVGTLRVNTLNTDAERTLTFSWATTGVPKGNYTLIAFAEPVSGETNTGDNTLAYDTVEVVAPPESYIALDWFNRSLVLLSILAVALLLLSFVVSRKKKKSEETFYSGWTAWYYCYDAKAPKPKMTRVSPKPRIKSQL